MLSREQIKASSVAELALALAVGIVTESLIEEVLGTSILNEVVGFEVSNISNTVLRETGVSGFLDDLFS